MTTKIYTTTIDQSISIYFTHSNKIQCSILGEAFGMRKKKAQSLCFNCDDKFIVGHKCKRPQLLLLERSTSTSNIKCEKVIDELLEENIPKLQHEPEIFLHALTGWSTPKTMIVTSKVGQHEFVVLIDNESTNDFIGDKMANSLHLHVVSTKPFTVRVTNWNKLHCQERFEHVHIMLQGIYFSFTLYLSYLTKLDLVFGV